MPAKTCGCRRSLDEDLEAYSLCFFENDFEEKFYDAPAPNEDIWKKFELLPTPPVSPKHETNYPNNSDCKSPLGDLEDLISQTDISLESLMGLPEDCSFCSSNESTDLNLKSNLIQDCMWSGLNLAKELLGGGMDTTKSTTELSNVASTNHGLDINATTDCVDPASVFPYPINDQPSREADSLGHETPSDSEDEEIDVVTVNDKVQITRRRPIMPAAPSMSAQVAAMHNYNAPASSAPRSPPPARNSPRSSPLSQKRGRPHRDRDNPDGSSSHPPLKKLRISNSQNSDLRSVVQKLRVHTGHTIVRHSGGRDGGAFSSASRSNTSSSDSEDGECRRSQHNILERKRRNDLKYSFELLRDNVPDLRTTDKTPKVTILRKATDFILSLRQKDRHYQKQLDYQKQRREQLQRRLRQLRQMSL